MTAPTFSQLVALRKAWIEQELKPWCTAARLADLKMAELEWPDIAGKVAPDATLWAWAWSRFPALVHPELGQIDETREVVVMLHDGRRVVGFPDARQSRQGTLVVFSRQAGALPRYADAGPFVIDDIAQITRLE